MPAFGGHPVDPSQDAYATHKKVELRDVHTFAANVAPPDVGPVHLTPGLNFSFAQNSQYLPSR